RENIDVKPVMSTDAAINYIAKYASKSEQQAPAFPQLLANVVASMNEAGTAKSACQKLLNKMLGERTYSAQETAHLLLGVPLVRTSVSFQTLTIAAEGGVREVHAVDRDDEGSMAEDPEEREVTGDAWFQRFVWIKFENTEEEEDDDDEEVPNQDRPPNNDDWQVFAQSH
ncbi:hypothetical protein R3P38DRAFT_2481780, partial [Favolaschia claudopus]